MKWRPIDSCLIPPDALQTSLECAFGTPALNVLRAGKGQTRAGFGTRQKREMFINAEGRRRCWFVNCEPRNALTASRHADKHSQEDNRRYFAVDTQAPRFRVKNVLKACRNGIKHRLVT